MEKYHVVKYSGPFGFIKTWTAVRDSETFSQQFLKPYIVAGLAQKLFPELLSESGIKKIAGHRLSYAQVNQQQEVIQTRGWNTTRKGKQILFERPTAVLNRGVLLYPVLFLAFRNPEDAEKAFRQHICICRNEDILLPIEMKEVTHVEFDTEDEYAGYELVFEQNENSFHVGYDRK